MCGLAPSAEPHVQQFRPLCSLLCSKGVPGTAVRQPVRELWPSPGTCLRAGLRLCFWRCNTSHHSGCPHRRVGLSVVRGAGSLGCGVFRSGSLRSPTPSRLRLLHKQQMLQSRHLASHLLSLLLSSETQPDCLSKQTVNSTIRPF